MLRRILNVGSMADLNSSWTLSQGMPWLEIVKWARRFDYGNIILQLEGKLLNI